MCHHYLNVLFFYFTEAEEEPFDHQLGDSSCFEEIAALPDGEVDDYLYPDAHPPGRIHFSTKPIKVSLCS